MLTTDTETKPVPPPVAIVVGGVLVAGSTQPRLCRDVVMAPLSPYLRDVAERIVIDPMGARIVVQRGSRTVWIAIGSHLLQAPGLSEPLPRAPYVRDGQPIVPIAAVARALGASVTYDADAKMLEIDVEPEPVVRMTIDPTYTPPAEPLATFTPNPTPAPNIEVTGSPRPRRTPIPVSTASSAA